MVKGLTIRAGIIVGLLLSTSAVATAAPFVPLHQYAQKQWRVADGLPSDTLHAILQTRDGYLWFGTDSGLARFDGVRFTRFDTDTTPSLTANRITGLAEDKEGTLWIATDNGLWSMTKGTFRRYTVADGLNSEALTAVIAGSKGDLWIGTRDRGVNCYHNHQFLSFTTVEGLSGNCVTTLAQRPTEAGGDELFVGTRRGLTRFNNGTLTRIGPPRPITALHVNPAQGQLWFATEQGTVHLLDSRGVHPIDWADPAPRRVNALFSNSRNTVWAGTERGLYRQHRGKLVPHSRRYRFLDEVITVVRQDWEESLWIGTATDDVHYLRREKFVSYSQRDGLTDGPVELVSGDESGRVYCVVDGGLYQFDNGRFTPVGSVSSAEGIRITALHPSAEGALLLGRADGRLEVLREGQSAIRESPGADREGVSAIAEDAAGRIWLAYRHHLMRLGNGEEETFDIAPGPSGEISFLFIDRSDTVRIETDGAGLYRYNRSMTRFIAQSGLVSNHLTSMGQDRNRDLWIGTRHRGLMRYRGGAFVLFSRQDGLPDATFNSIVEDELGRLWSNTARGLARIDIQALHDFADGKRATLPSKLYGLTDGLLSLRSAGVGNRSIWTGPDGRIWFGQERGLSVVDPSRLYTKKVPPKIHIEKFFVAGYREEIAELQDELRQKYTGSGVSAAELERIATVAQAEMEREKPYRDDTLTIGKLATRLGVSANHLSYALNGTLHQNFHGFVNTYRIAEAKRLLAAPSRRDDSILTIAFEAGFKSKSTFNALFKATVGLTPSAYRKSVLSAHFGRE